MSQPLPPKKDVALALLERSSVFFLLDPRAEGVLVPVWLKRQPILKLQVGLNMPVPIPDLQIEDDGMSCTLSFNRSPFFCSVPWKAIFAMETEQGTGMVWPDDIPPEVPRVAPPAPVSSPVLQSVDQDKAARPKRKKPQLVSLDRDEPIVRPSSPQPEPLRLNVMPATEASPAPAPRPAQHAVSARKPKRELPPYLRVVK